MPRTSRRCHCPRRGEQVEAGVRGAARTSAPAMPTPPRRRSKRRRGNDGGAVPTVTDAGNPEDLVGPSEGRSSEDDAMAVASTPVDTRAPGFPLSSPPNPPGAVAPNIVMRPGVVLCSTPGGRDISLCEPAAASPSSAPATATPTRDQMLQADANAAMDSLVALQGVGRTKLSHQQYAPRIKKFREWAQKQDEAWQDTTNLETAAHYAIQKLFGEAGGAGGQRKPTMSKPAWYGLLSALQHELRHGKNLQGLGRTGEVPKIRECPQIKNASKVVEGSMGTRAHQHETGCLSRHIQVADREFIVAGSLVLAYNAAKRHSDPSERRSFHDMVTGRLIFLSQDDSLGRGTEVAAGMHLGGLTTMPPYHQLGPNPPQNLVFTHNQSKQNQDAAYDVHVHNYDKVDAFVAASSLVALSDSLVMLSELNDLCLMDDANPIPNGWQHCNVHSTYVKGRATGKLISDASINDVFQTAINDMKSRFGVGTKKVKHALRGMSSKRKTIEHGCPTATQTDMRYMPTIFDQHYCQEIVDVKTLAVGLFADPDVVARQEWHLASFMPRRDVGYPRSSIFGNEGKTLFPRLRLQLNSDAFSQRCRELDHVNERDSLLRVLDVLDEHVLSDYAMLFAQIELYAENEENVPVFRAAKLLADDLTFTRENHPVWSRMAVFGTDDFKELTKNMREVWMSRERLRAEAMQRDHDVSMSSLGLQVTRLATAVAASNRSHVETLEALSRRVEEMEANKDARFQAGVQAGVEMALRSLGMAGGGVPTGGATDDAGDAAAAPARDDDAMTQAGRARAALPSSGGVPVRAKPDPIFAKAKHFKRPSDCFSAYHDTFEGIGPASRDLRVAGFSTKNPSHAKFWSKIRHVVFNIYHRVKHGDDWPVMPSVTVDGNTVADHEVYRQRLTEVVQEADEEYLSWATVGAGGTIPKGRGLLAWCASHDTSFTQVNAPPGWHERLWPEDTG